MSEPQTIKEAEAAAALARRKVEALKAIMDDEKRKAREEVEEKHRPAISAATAELVVAERAITEAKDRLPAHPWTGMRVCRAQETRRHNWDPRRPVRIEGVVETRRSDTEFPGNVASYSLPKIGDGFVRLLNKDGKPGKKFERLAQGWALVEDQKDGQK